MQEVISTRMNKKIRQKLTTRPRMATRLYDQIDHPEHLHQGRRIVLRDGAVIRKIGTAPSWTHNSRKEQHTRPDVLVWMRGTGDHSSYHGEM